MPVGEYKMKCHVIFPWKGDDIIFFHLKTQTWKTDVVAKGEGEGREMFGEFGVNRCKILHLE